MSDKMLRELFYSLVLGLAIGVLASSDPPRPPAAGATAVPRAR
jgi:hypothetical protein